MDHFELVTTVAIKHIRLNEYKSKLTGTRVFIGIYNCPLVYSFFVVPTEADTDEGLPHTLEHLIFLGSKNYPERGVLELISNRCLSVGTNAWTSVDHTCYHITTAGLQGTLQIMPIFLDHILQPLLSEDSFLTDVHYINANGQSSGVVFCEMKACEHTLEDMMYHKSLDMLYPGDSSYKKNTGGKMEDLKVTNIERVREYHSKYYKWDNLSLCFLGGIDDEKAILSKVAEAERSIIQTPKTVSPWSDDLKNIKELKESQTTRFKYPSDNEEYGKIGLSWRGPKYNEFKLNYALNILGSYLSESSTSPLESNLIHVDNPWGSGVEFAFQVHKSTYFYISLNEVPLDKIDQASEHIMNILKTVEKSPIDMERMETLIERARINYLREMETCLHDTVIDSLIEYIVYSKDSSDLGVMIEEIGYNEYVKGRSESFWKDLLRKWFIENPVCVCIGIPSEEEAKRIEEEEEKLEAKNIEKYGKNALESISKYVEGLLDSHGPSKDLIDSFELCDISKIKLPKRPVYCNYLPTDSNVKIDNIKYPLQLNDIESDFVQIHVLFNVEHAGLEEDEVKMLQLLCDNLFEFDVKIDGGWVNREELVERLYKYTTFYGANIGLSSARFNPDSYSQFINVTIVGPVEHYNNIVKLLHSIISPNAELNIPEDRFRQQINILKKKCNKKKSSSRTLLNQLISSHRYKYESISNRCGLAQQDDFLSKKVSKTQYLDLCKKVFSNSKMLVQIVTDHKKLDKNWEKPWAYHKDAKISGSLREHFNMIFRYDHLEKYFNGTIICNTASVSVSYFAHILDVPVGFEHQDYVPLLILTSIMSICEGPLFRLIRGGGYSYGCYMSYLPMEGELHMEIPDAGDLVSALKIVNEYIRDEKNINSLVECIDNAKASVAFSVVNKEETLTDHAYQTMVNALKGLPHYYSQTLLTKISKVTEEDIRRVADEYLKFFLPENWSNRNSISIITNNKMLKEVKKGLEDLGYPNVYTIGCPQMISVAAHGTIKGY